jgi:MurNAc alpha-1-phosphate uridylyltransferase
MEAMILAAGTGTRLKPLTDRIPKALIEVKGRPMLARVLDRLIEAGATRIIVNVHHHEKLLGSS